MITFTSGQELQYLLQALASACDGASTRDGAGFNRYDSQIGKLMASRPQASWSEKDAIEMYWLLRKYHVQLTELTGIEWKDVPKPVVESHNSPVELLASTDKW